MARTIEGILANHKAASKLRSEGKPIWAETITATRVDGGSFKRNRNAFATALKRSMWFKRAEPDDELHQLWDEIKDADDADHFDICLDAIYDLADEDRIFIKFDHQ